MFAPLSKSQPEEVSKLNQALKRVFSVQSHPGHGDDADVLRVAGGAAARAPERRQHAADPLRADPPVDGVARRLRRAGHPRARVVVADGLDGGGHHAGHQPEDPGQRDDRDAPLNCNDITEGLIRSVHIRTYRYAYRGKGI